MLDHTVNNTGNSVLNLAAAHCSEEVVQALCKHFRKSEDHDYKSYLFHKTDNQRSLLHHAIQQNNSEVYEFLNCEVIGFGGNLSRDKDNSDMTPVDYIKHKLDELYGEGHAQRLENDDGLRDAKYLNGFEPWESCYVTNYLGDIQSWISPMRQLQYKHCTVL